MSQTTIQVSTDAKHDFFQKYLLLGDRQKCIWKLLVWYCKKFPSAFPKQERIAQSVGCTREYVNRTIGKFKKFGWIFLENRGHWRTRIMHILEDLQMIDLNHMDYFKKIEITSEVICEITPSYSTKKKEITSKAGLADTQPIEIPLNLQKSDFSQKNKLLLSLLSERTVEEMKYVHQKLLKTDFRPRDPENYLKGVAIKIAKKNREFIDWKRYYANTAKMNVA